MRARLNGEIKSMSRGAVDSDSALARNATWVTLEVDVTGSVTDGVKGTNSDAKATGAEISLRIKPIVANELKFGQKLYFEVSTEPPTGSDERIYCYYCGGKLDRKGPRDCPVCS